MQFKLLLAGVSALLIASGSAFAAEDIVTKAERESLQQVSAAKALMQPRASKTEKPVGLQETLLTMYAYNPDIQAAKQNVKAVAEDLSIAMINFLPNVAANADITRTDIEFGDDNGNGGGNNNNNNGFGEGDGTSQSASVEANQPLFRGGRSVAEKREAENMIAAAVANQKAIIQQQITNAITAHVDVLRAQAVQELNVQNEKRLIEQLRATKLRYEVGELTRTDVSQAEARLSAAQADLTKSNAALRTAKADYRRIVGREPVGLAFPDMMPKLPKSMDEAQQNAVKFSPVLQQAYFETNAARAQIKNAFGRALPTVGIRAGYGKTYDPVGASYDEETTSNIGVVASIPLYSGGGNAALVRQSKATAKQREENERATLEQIRADVTAAWENYEATKDELKAREKQLAAAALALKSIQMESEVGQRAIIDVLDAQQEYLSAQTDLVTTQRDEIVNAYVLAANIGMLDPVSMKLDPKFPDAAKIIRKQRKGF